MTKKSNPVGAYYYADGKKIALAPADDLFALESHQAWSAAEGAVAIGRALTNGLRLVTKDELGSGALESKPTYPVFRSHGATVVVLPEVRVEESRKSHWAKLDKWLAAHDGEVTVVSRDANRVVLKPLSGLGGDALTIANDLAEEVGPEMAQARFIRVTPRPT